MSDAFDSSDVLLPYPITSSIANKHHTDIHSQTLKILDSKLLDFDGHYARLQLSLDKLQLSSFKLSRDELLEVHRQLVTRNSIVEGMIYLQVTRGNPGDRDFAYPSDSSNTPATVVLFTQDQGVGGLTDAAAAEEGMRVMTLKDLRWGRVDIKTVQVSPD